MPFIPYHTFLLHFSII